jgi:UDP-N-acetylglucosamine--N-acetylmuramyl-(pentapeptide) pyrophosphoryl-undecaprenol N-acetylglucosamine transferase
MSRGTFVLAAGGTGGHLFPAQALAGELMRRGRRVIVMTDGRGHNYASAFPGAEIATVPAATIGGRSPIKWITSCAVIIGGIFSAFRKLRRLHPVAVIGFGGYPSLPVMVAAWAARVPSALHEQNAVLGRVNRLVAPFVSKIAAAFPFARKAPKHIERVSFIGNPVRDQVIALRGAPYIPPQSDGPIRILIFGGSQGARALSEIVPAALERLNPSLRARLDVTQQCRADDLEKVEAFYAKTGIKAEAAKFFSDLPRRMADSHLIISRSGASTLGELTVIGRPAILIPYPFAMDDHQAANAAVLAKANAAWMVRENALDATKLSEMLEKILSDPKGLIDCAANAAALGHPDAASRLADIAEAMEARI